MLKNTIEAIKGRITLSKIVGERIRLRQAGTRLVGLCPFHKEKTPSFSVNDDGRFYYCFGCGKGGDVIDFISETENVSFNEALEKLALLAGIDIKKEKKNPVADKIAELLEDLTAWFMGNLYSRVGENARLYIENRLDKKSIEKFKLGYCPQNLSGYEQSKSLLREAGILDANNKCYYSNRIVFPIQNKSGAVIAFGSRTFHQNVLPKYINSPETIFFKKSEVLYGINLAKNSCREKLIVVEGYMDVISLNQYGYPNVVGTLGTSITQQHMEQVFRLSNEIIFCFDGDTAGLNAAQRAIRIIMANFISDLKTKVRFAFLPAGKDPDDLVRHNNGYFQSLLDRSLQISETVFYLSTMNCTFNTPEDYITLEQTLFSYIDATENKQVKNHFRDFFKKQIFLLKRKKVVTQDLKLNLLGSSPKQEDIIISLVVKFPELLNNPDVEEHFSMMKFEKSSAKTLQQRIIEFLNQNPVIERENFFNFVQQDNLKDGIYHITNVNQAMLLWKKIIRDAELKNLESEYKRLLQEATSSNQLERAQLILAKIHSYQD